MTSTAVQSTRQTNGPSTALNGLGHVDKGAWALPHSDDTTPRAIETVYKGYRFRSRLEARWALFLDELGVRWEYEKEGYDLGAAGWYLPDFWLPDQSVWIEIKPSGSEGDNDKLLALIAATGHSGWLVRGDPKENVDQWWFEYCPGCGKVGAYLEYGCCGISARSKYIRRLRAAADKARQWRFQRSDSGYTFPISKPGGRLYLAGKINERSWRDQILKTAPADRFFVIGPDSHGKHSGDWQYIAQNCTESVSSADVVFAWIDGDDCHGTLAEIGMAVGFRTPVFVAFKDEATRGANWFAGKIAVEECTAPTPELAYDLFEQWWSWINERPAG